MKTWEERWNNFVADLARRPEWEDSRLLLRSSASFRRLSPLSLNYSQIRSSIFSTSIYLQKPILWKYQWLLYCLMSQKYLISWLKIRLKYLALNVRDIGFLVFSFFSGHRIRVPFPDAPALSDLSVGFLRTYSFFYSVLVSLLPFSSFLFSLNNLLLGSPLHSFAFKYHLFADDS